VIIVSVGVGVLSIQSTKTSKDHVFQTQSSKNIVQVQLYANSIVFVYQYTVSFIRQLKVGAIFHVNEVILISSDHVKINITVQLVCVHDGGIYAEVNISGDTSSKIVDTALP
jgi:hypothetical protein